MINIDFINKTFICPYCGKEQSYSENNMCSNFVGYKRGIAANLRMAYEFCDINILHILCTNRSCRRIIVVAHDLFNSKQWDLIPENICNHYPDYIPYQIRNDYEEASSIIERSPKAAAALFRRCLQGMIHDFWNIHEKNLNAEITVLKERVSLSQWKALDGLRSIGNIGAHMEKDVNLIIEIEPDEAIKLQKLIELLLNKWYIANHEEEELYAEIAQAAEKKAEQRKDK